MADIKKKTILSMAKLKLTAPCPTAKGKWSNLGYDIYNNNPRVVVATNDPEFTTKERSFGRIQAAMDPALFYMYLELLKRAADSKEACGWKVTNSGASRSDPKAVTHMSDLHVGKGEDGCVYVSVTSPDNAWPKIKFTFGPSDGRFATFTHKNGAEFSKAELSCLAAKGHYNMLSEIIGNLLVVNYVEPEPWNGNKGGGGKPAYNNNKSNYQASGSSSSEADDGDLPF